MAGKWKTVGRGVRYRQHPTRKHGKQLDRYYAIRHRIGSRRIEEALGWASEGWTLDKALGELAKLKEAGRTGHGEPTLRAKRAKAAQERAAEAERGRLEKTVEDLWNRYSMEVVAANKPRTAGEKRRMWNKKVKPAIGALKVNSVTGEDAGAIVRASLKLNDKGAIIGGKAEAGNLYRFLHHLFGKALIWGLRSKALGNPLATVDEPKTLRRERLLSARDVGALLGTLAKGPKQGAWHLQIVTAIRAVILSGARIRELLSVRWSDVRRDEMEIHLRDTKTGFSRRPLSTELLMVLDAAGRMPGSAYVFRGIEDPKKPLDYYIVRDTFREVATQAKVKNCTLHTIRHWYATMTANSVSNPRIGMALTGHKSHEAYMRYVHGDKEQAKALANQLASAAVGFEHLPGNVERLPMKRKPKRRARAA